MKTELAKLEFQKSQLASLKDSLTDVPVNIYSKDWKYRESNIGKLDYYLGNNDCISLPESLYRQCYLQTRLLLIATTKELDAANDQINNLNQVIDRLNGNIVAVVDSISAPSKFSLTK